MSCCNANQQTEQDVENVAAQIKAMGPKSASVGGDSFSAHSIGDLIAWQRHQLTMKAARNPLGAIGNVRLSPSSSCRRS